MNVIGQVRIVPDEAAIRTSEREACAKLCETEAAACIGDIVAGDELGAKLANARAGALLTAAADIRAPSPAAQAGCAKEGWQLVPKKPTAAMVDAAFKNREALIAVDTDLQRLSKVGIVFHPGFDYAAMLSASPPPPVAESGWQDSDPHPRWKPGDKSDRHPQTVEEWDYRNDPVGGAFDASLRRLCVAGDYADPRVPLEMAAVLRIDLIRLIHDWYHKNAAWESCRTTPAAPDDDPLAALPAPLSPFPIDWTSHGNVPVVVEKTKAKS